MNWTFAIIQLAIFSTSAGRCTDDPCRSESRVNTFTLSAQDSAALDVLPDGDLIIAWASRRQDDGFSGVFARWLSNDGSPRGPEFRISELTGCQQRVPAVAAGPRGELWFVWEAFGPDGDAAGICARRMDSAGQADPQFIVNQQSDGAQVRPVIAVNAEGVVAIAWLSAPRNAPGMDVRCRLFSAGGAPLSDEIAIPAAPGMHAAGLVSICSSADGGFVLATVAQVNSEEGSAIIIRRLTAWGAPVGEFALLPSATGGEPVEPVIAATCDGYVVAWHEYGGDDAGYDVWARRVDPIAGPLGTPVRVHEITNGTQNAAAVAITDDGRIAFAWNEIPGADSSVAARWFDDELNPISNQFALSANRAGPQQLAPGRPTRRLTAQPDGTLLCAWNGDGGMGDSNGVHLTRLGTHPIGGATHALLPAPPDVAIGLRAGEPAEPHRPPTYRPIRGVRPAQRRILTGNGIGFNGISDTGWDPPDPILAVGPKHLVVMTNGGIAFYRKDGTEDFFDEIDGQEGFWGELGVTNFVFDPEVLYDPDTRRFFAICVEAHVTGERSFLLLAISDDENPNGNWFRYRIETTDLSGDVLDSPNLAIDSRTLYVTGDGHGRGGNYPVYVFDKAALARGDAPEIVNSFELTTTTQSAGIPSLSFDAPALYMIEHQEGNRSRAVRLIAMRDALESPRLDEFELDVPNYGEPEDPEHKSGAFRLETFDARFWSVYYRDGSLWATHHINENHVVARWYQIALNGWPVSGDFPTLTQSGEIKPASRVRTFFSAIAVDKLGNAAMTFARTSPTDTVSMSTAYRLRDDAEGTFRDDVIHQTSGELLVFSRWGDYAGVRVDPADGRTFWAIHEYAEKFEWRTWIVGFNPTFDLGDLNCDGGIDFGDIDPFVLTLSDPDGYGAAFPECDITLADINADGSVDFDDIDPFVDLLIR